MALNFSDPATVRDEINWRDVQESVLAFRVGHSITVATKYGEKPAVVADVLVCTGAQEFTEYTQVEVIPVKLRRAIESADYGSVVIGRVTQGRAFGDGGSAPWVLDAVTGDERKRAQEMALAQWDDDSQPKKGGYGGSNDEPPF